MTLGLAHFTQRAQPTFEAMLSNRRNSIGFLRWAFAVLVVVDHSIPIGGFTRRIDVLGSWSGGRNSLGGFAVGGFFVLSGYLVTLSWQRSTSTSDYLWRRSLRIAPAYWVCLAMISTMFAPAAWLHEHRTLGGYLGASGNPPLGYVLRNAALTVRQPTIGGLLKHIPLADTGFGAEWNGSLWTLQYEVACYLLLAVLAALGWRARRWPLVLLCTLCYLGVVVQTADPHLIDFSVGPLAVTWLAQFGFLFLAAALVARHADRIVVDDRLGVLACLAVLGTMPTPAWRPIGYPALVYLILWAAARLPVRHWERFGDLSYGTYIYAFPIQVLLAEFGAARHGALLFVLSSLALTSLAAFLSWHLIEKRALRLKTRRVALNPRRAARVGAGAP